MCVVNGGQGVSILSGGVAAVISKNRCMANAKEKPLCRHSSAGGNPDFDLLEMFKVNRYFKLPDSCFRGNGDMTVFNFNLL
ncbi:hypothetical protein CIJ83_03060 [Neisseria meningitidis]|uniref:hypothetical protein n=1 Tax=Neisseria meningitidis TaxID=487 RepID=UPI0002FB1C78|nr:hypothetical protein [Neisseria meningitidis]MBG8595761.1 hypothetical protein [Neisseria meningitidis]MBG8637736.1 hypothetical protein [Neisseria meningitidis]MBG8656098.1 hypothetical protein [Neisseria meningitidis]MBG8658351.1 hypothetical protein [Neisseria meningitidis]MBG8665001.1 hypothetical protein [Neisseria meningitidis]